MKNEIEKFLYSRDNLIKYYKIYKYLFLIGLELIRTQMLSS